VKVASIVLCLPFLVSCERFSSRAEADCRSGPTQITKVWGDPAPAREGVSYGKLNHPDYPPQALADKVTGIVFLHVWIQPNRSVSKVTVEQIYPRAAVALTVGLADVVQGWKFNSVAIYGNPIASEAIVPVRFNIVNYTPPLIAESRPPLPKDVYVLDMVEVEGTLPSNINRGTRYHATFALLPAQNGGFQGCVVTSVALANNLGKHLEVPPTEAFMKAACTHFGATWPSETFVDYLHVKVEWEVAAWYPDAPDVPMYLPTHAL